mmetsp:Transcript_3397/g.7960  ORF Transcript_3397/g.7960 Transcript_3397/m.7960 type:complete len:344 (-) Transcript_3397:204-1235(-)
MEAAYAAVGCTVTAATSPLCTPSMVATHLVPAHSFTVLSAEHDSKASASAPPTQAMPVTFLPWPVRRLARMPLAALNRAIEPSAPAVATIVVSAGCTAMAAMPCALVLCTGAVVLQPSAATASGVARLSEISRFLRYFSSSLLFSTMASTTSLGTPPLARLPPASTATAALAAAAPRLLPTATTGIAPVACADARWVRASSRSLIRRATTRHAASCWYRACDSSWRVACRSLRRSLVSSISASHSLWKEASMPGMEVDAAGLGFTALFALIGSRSSSVSGVFVTGHSPVSWSALVMSERSKRWPVRAEITGSSGVVPLIAQNIATDDATPPQENKNSGWTLLS